MQLFCSDFGHTAGSPCRRVNLRWDTIMQRFRDDSYDVAAMTSWDAVSNLDPMAIRRNYIYSCRVYYTSEREAQRLIIVDREVTETDS